MNDEKLRENKTYCWMRQLEVRLYSKLYKVKPLIFGTSKVKSFEWKENNNSTLVTEAIADQLNINVKITKKLSALEDNGTCDIYNLTYETIVNIILGQYYRIEIWAGYRTQGPLKCFFSGEIAFISNEIQMRRDHTCHIVFASSLVAGYSQRRINCNLNSGINLYAALRYICINGGINNPNINQNLKNEFLNEVISNWGTPATLAQTLANQTANYSISTDSSTDGVIVDCSSLNDKRQIRINSQTISFRKGNPRLTKDGITMSLLPTFDFKPGDIVIIDNSLINMSENSLSGVQSNFSSNYIDTTFANTETPNLGAYMIREIDCNFQNRGDEFSIEITARAVSIIKSTLGLNY